MSQMRYRRLGDTDLQVSVVGLGCNNMGRVLDESASRALVDAAIDEGITFFDTAQIYGKHPGDSERLLGAALAGRRDDVVVATKFFVHPDGRGPSEELHHGSREFIRAAIDGSLRRLRTDHVDLYQMHIPDPATPIEETLGALDELVRDGKIRSIGSSNFKAWMLVNADWVARTAGVARFVSAQNRYSLLSREAEEELFPACGHLNVAVIPYAPLANGLLTGKYRRGAPAPANTRLSTRQEVLDSTNWGLLERLQDFANQRGISLLELAIGGLAALPCVASVIAGATTADQVRSNALAGRWTPTEDDLVALKQLDS